jgi:3'(2'), 5'-bisphosphate nucleotidase
MMESTEKILDDVIRLAKEAGTAILQVYASSDFGTTYKDDQSPLTLADTASNEVIVAGLAALTPELPVLSEESREVSYQERAEWERFWLVDPLDGTREFIKRNGEFTVNIALIDRCAPVLGVVHSPVLGVTYAGTIEGGAFKTDRSGTEKISVADYTAAPALKVVASRSHGGDALERFFERLGAGVERVGMGSSLKLCLVADGTAHLYPRLGPTMEWDTAAAHAVVDAAGGAVCDLDGAPLRYNKQDLLNPFFMVTGSPPFPSSEYID